MADFDRQKFLNNISNILTQRGIKVGEFETSIGVYPGYLSRLKAEENKMPPFDIVWKMGQYLNMNVELLADGNFEHPTENLNYLQKFARKLFDRTVSGEFEWTPVTTGDINMALLSDDEKPKYPFIERTPVDRGKDLRSLDLENYGCMSNSGWAAKYNMISSFGLPHTSVCVDGTAFRTTIYGQGTLYLICFVGEVCDPPFEYGGIPEPCWYYELMIDSPTTDGSRKVIPVCNTLKNCEPLRVDLKKLYDELKNHEFDLRITTDARTAIDAFMASDPEDIPF